jgi:hypothetical protein
VAHAAIPVARPCLNYAGIYYSLLLDVCDIIAAEIFILEPNGSGPEKFEKI